MCLKTLVSLITELDNRIMSANELQHLKLQLAEKLDFCYTLCDSSILFLDKVKPLSKCA